MSILRKIVRNEASKNDPPEIYNVRAFGITIIACGGAMLFGMDMGIIGGVLTMKSFKEEYDLLDRPAHDLAALSSNIVSVIQAGAFLGAIIAMWLADRIGRKPSLIVASIVVSIGVAMQAGASGNLGVLYAGRSIAGLAIGIASTVTPLYVSENAPRAIRGLLTGFYQLCLVFALTLAFWINYGCSLGVTGKKQFIIPLALQMWPAVFLFFGMLFANESPRHIARKDPAKAKAVLAKLRGLSEDHEYVLEEIANIEMQLEHERSLRGSNSQWSIIKEAFTVKSYRRRTVLCFTLMMWSNLTGTNAMTYYSPTIFASVGLSAASAGLFATGVYGIVKMCACAVFIFFVSDTLGRRKSLLWTGIAQGIALFYVGFYVCFDPPIKGQPITAPGYVAIVAIYFFAACYQFGWGPVVWTYCSEMPPARLRAFQMGFATASQWLWNFVVAKGTPLMFATLGSHGFGTYFLYGSFCFTMVVYAFFFVPETKGLSLESMDELFAQDNIRAKFVPTAHFAVEEDVDKKTKSKIEIEHLEKI